MRGLRVAVSSPNIEQRSSFANKLPSPPKSDPGRATANWASSLKPHPNDTRSQSTHKVSTASPSLPRLDHFKPADSNAPVDSRNLPHRVSIHKRVNDVQPTNRKLASLLRASELLPMLNDSKDAQRQGALKAHHESKPMANAAWKDQRLRDCEAHLNVSIDQFPRCDVLRRYRANVRAKLAIEGVDSDPSFDKALNDAESAVAICPGSHMNHYAHGLCLQRKRRLQEAGNAYLASMKYGREGTSDEIGYSGFLNTVRRERHYFSRIRPAHLKPMNPIQLARGSSIFDPDKIFDDAEVTDDTLELPEAPQLFLVDARSHALSVSWLPGRRQEGDVTICSYELQIAKFEVVWEGERFFEGFRPYEQLHSGAGHTLAFTVEGLRAESVHKVRLRAIGYSGASDWTEIEATTAPPPSRDTSSVAVPRSWMNVELTELVQNHVIAVGGDAKRFFVEIATVLRPQTQNLKRLFLGWSKATAVGQRAERDKALTRLQFSRFVRGVGLCQDKGVTNGKNDAHLLTAKQVDLIFQRANGSVRSHERADPHTDHTVDVQLVQEAVEELTTAGLVAPAPQGRRVTEAASTEMESDARWGLEGSPEGMADDTDEDVGESSMAIHEFVHALLMLAWECYPAARDGIGSRLYKLLHSAVLPGSSQFFKSEDPMEAELNSKRVQAITDYYADDLSEAFRAFADTDQTAVGQFTLHSMSYGEVVYMLEQTNLLDEKVTVTTVSELFSLVNQIGFDDGEDEDRQEMCYAEFLHFMVRFANAKIPIESRHGEPFEHTWKAFLQIMFLPRCRRFMESVARAAAVKKPQRRRGR